MSDIDEKVVLTVTVEGAMAQVERSDKPQFMLDGDYDMNTLFGTCSLMAQMAKELSTPRQSPTQLVAQMAKLAMRLL